MPAISNICILAAAGAIMVVMGLAMITGQISTFSFWLLEQFPIFTRIG